MIHVMEIIQLNSDATILVCNMFPDEVITKTINSDAGLIRNFVVETLKECFSVPQTRDILVYGSGNSQITQIEFV